MIVLKKFLRRIGAGTRRRGYGILQTELFLRYVIRSSAWICAALFLFHSTLYLTGCGICLVVSGSMSPAIPTGSVVCVSHNSPNPDVGDVIVYSADGRDIPIIHRVVARTEDGYVTKGDANRSADPNTVRTDQLDGRVVWSVPWIGYPLVLLRSSPTRLRGAVCSLTLALFFLVCYKRAEKRLLIPPLRDRRKGEHRIRPGSPSRPIVHNNKEVHHDCQGRT